MTLVSDVNNYFITKCSRVESEIKKEKLTDSVTFEINQLRQ
jgi:hypothetical protein